MFAGSWDALILAHIQEPALILPIFFSWDLVVERGI
jgi:hypothetical protein